MLRLTPRIGQPCRGAPRIAGASPAAVARMSNCEQVTRVPRCPSASHWPTERGRRALSRLRGSASQRFKRFRPSPPRRPPWHIIARRRFSQRLSAGYDLRPVLCQEIVYRRQLRSGIAQSRCARVARLTALPEATDRHDLGCVIPHLRVRKYACRNASVTDRLGDASQ
jgi:hypothetical protein